MRLRYELGLRHRAAVDESITDRHARLVDGLRTLGSPWGIPADYVATGPVIEPGDLSTRVSLKGVLGRPLNAFVEYVVRSPAYLRSDNAQYDDILFVDFDPEKVDFSDFARSAFPVYVEAFDAYRATVAEDSLAADDWSVVRDQANETGKDVDGREGIYRINAIGYYDRLLCQRAFGRAPKAIVPLLNGHVERVEEFKDGILIVVDSKVLAREALKDVDGVIRRLLS